MHPKRLRLPLPSSQLGVIHPPGRGSLLLVFIPQLHLHRPYAIFQSTVAERCEAVFLHPFLTPGEKLYLRGRRRRLLPTLPPINSSSLSLRHPLIGRKFHVERSKLRRPWAPPSPQHPLMEHRCPSGKVGPQFLCSPGGKAGHKDKSYTFCSFVCGYFCLNACVPPKIHMLKS